MKTALEIDVRRVLAIQDHAAGQQKPLSNDIVADRRSQIPFKIAGELRLTDIKTVADFIQAQGLRKMAVNEMRYLDNIISIEGGCIFFDEGETVCQLP